MTQHVDGRGHGLATPIVSGACAKMKLTMPLALAKALLTITPPLAEAGTCIRNLKISVPLAGKLANLLQTNPVWPRWNPGGALTRINLGGTPGIW